jgi:hypothetical protein
VIKLVSDSHSRLDVRSALLDVLPDQREGELVDPPQTDTLRELEADLNFARYHFAIEALAESGTHAHTPLS